MKAVPCGLYRDPLDILLAQEARTCKGCAHTHKVFAIEICMKGRKHGNRCKQYSEKVPHAIQVS